MTSTPEAGWGPEEQSSKKESDRTSEIKLQIAGLRDRAIEGARQGFVDSVESGRAEQVGHRAIDVAAYTAERSLNALPPGTRLVGKFVGRKVIGRLQEGAHGRIDETLGQAADRLAVPSFTDYTQLEPTPSWGPGTAAEQPIPAPSAESGWGEVESVPASGGSWGPQAEDYSPVVVAEVQKRGLFKRRKEDVPTVPISGYPSAESSDSTSGSWW